LATTSDQDLGKTNDKLSPLYIRKKLNGLGVLVYPDQVCVQLASSFLPLAPFVCWKVIFF
jgi:hypothetical protein